MSRPREARNSPVRPPMRNRPRKPKTNIIGVFHQMAPLYSVAVQLNVFTAEGIATANDRNEKISAEYGEMPATNRWCAHTRNPKTAIARLEKATNEYPKTFLREKQAITSLMTPIGGRIMM